MAITITITATSITTTITITTTIMVTTTATDHEHDCTGTTRWRELCRCCSGSRRPSRSAPSPIRTGSNGRSRRATSTTPPRSPPGSPISPTFGAPRDRRRRCSPQLSRRRRRRLARRCEVNELAVALAGSAERRLETTAQGARLRRRRARRLGLRGARRSSGARRRAARLSGRRRRRGGGHAASRLKRACGPSSLGAFANLVSAAVRLGAIGQTDGPADPGRALAAPRRDGARRRRDRDARRSRRLRVPLRSRRDAARNAIFEAVPLMTQTQPPCASASAVPSAPARRR